MPVHNLLLLLLGPQCLSLVNLGPNPETPGAGPFGFHNGPCSPTSAAPLVCLGLQLYFINSLQPCQCQSRKAEHYLLIILGIPILGLVTRASVPVKGKCEWLMDEGGNFIYIWHPGGAPGRSPEVGSWRELVTEGLALLLLLCQVHHIVLCLPTLCFHQQPSEHSFPILYCEQPKLQAERACFLLLRYFG